MVLAQLSSGFIFNTLNAVIYTVCFLVPGFLSDLTLSRFISQKSEQVPLTLLRFLVFSCLNYIVWIVIYLLTLPWNKLILEYPILIAITLILVVFVSPVFLGWLLGYINKQELIERGLSSLGRMQTLSRYRVAWDYKFSRINEPLWLLVTLKDGSQVAGRFLANSLASSDPSERDLYLEEVYQFDDDNPWQPVPATSGIWIAGDEIRYIEFWKDQEEET